MKRAFFRGAMAATAILPTCLSEITRPLSAPGLVDASWSMLAAVVIARIGSKKNRFRTHENG